MITPFVQNRELELKVRLGVTFAHGLPTFSERLSFEEVVELVAYLKEKFDKGLIEELY